MAGGRAPSATGAFVRRNAARPNESGSHLVAPATETPCDDDALVRRIAAGDQTALRRVVEVHGPRLRALAGGFAGGGAEADDIVQECFVALWKHAGRWKNDGPPLAAWLTRVTINGAIDRERRRKVRAFFGLDQVAEPRDETAGQDRRLEAAGELAAVAADIEGLPPRQRAAILLAADGERSNAEIAAAMGQSVGAVEQLLVRARRTLRRQLAARAT